MAQTEDARAFVLLVYCMFELLAFFEVCAISDWFRTTANQWRCAPYDGNDYRTSSGQ
ncbi:hypothetical protein BDZ89DRAFT_1137261 [Hymenopellis radicata]|nr:hypothetical protein BDZ89DRAFT_1137261 [Hymenopellis radicata]